MIKKAYLMSLMGVALSMQTIEANPLRYYHDRISYKGYFKEYPTILTHHEAPYVLAQTPTYNPPLSRYASNQQEPYAPPKGDVSTQDNADPFAQGSDSGAQIPNTKTILYSSECVTVCPLPKDRNSLPKMQ